MNFILFFLSFLITQVCANKPPVWDMSYIAKGTIHIPYAEIIEPFSVWYTAERSRIDYYDGMVKTYQFSYENDYGALYKIVPVTNDKQLNNMTCLKINGSATHPIDAQTVLPDCTNFTYAGIDHMSGHECDKFVYEDTTIEQKKNSYTLWVRYKKSPIFPGSRMPIPIRYEMKGINTILGMTHYDHYYLDYDYFSHEYIPYDIFDFDTGDEPCTGFPEPTNGGQHYVTFNPMQEFIRPHADEHIDMEFNHFIDKHNKKYKTDNEHYKRRHVFLQNLRYIQSKNRQNLSFRLAINHLADKTRGELKTILRYRSPTEYNGGMPFPYSTTENLTDQIPVQHDWRLFGAVTSVKDQSLCGSSWAFGTIGSIEGIFFLHNGKKLMKLSQQALIDCSWGFGNHGCDGGQDIKVYKWMMHMGGVPTEDAYGPYLGQDGYCHVKNVSLVAPIRGYVNVTSNDINALKIAIFKEGPITISIDASRKAFAFYSHGVHYDPKCGNKLNELNHSVVAVGYGIMNGEFYFLIKNSWSNYWGNDGYILMSPKNNNCGILTNPTYVLIKR